MAVPGPAVVPQISRVSTAQQIPDSTVWCGPQSPDPGWRDAGGVRHRHPAAGRKTPDPQARHAGRCRHCGIGENPAAEAEIPGGSTRHLRSRCGVAIKNNRPIAHGYKAHIAAD